MEPVVLDKFGFKNRLNRNIKLTVLHFQPTKVPIFETKQIIVLYKSHVAFKIINLSIQTLEEEFKALVFVKDELECGDIPMTFLPLMANQDSNSDAKKKNHDL